MLEKWIEFHNKIDKNSPNSNKWAERRCSVSEWKYWYRRNFSD